MIKELLTLDVVNKNNRIYPRTVMEKAIADVEDLIKTKRFVIFTGNPFTHNISDIAGVIKELKIDGNKVIADVELLNTPAGVPIKEMIDSIYVRTCGEGSITKNEQGQDIVGNDYKLTHCIFTFDPS